MDMNLEIISKQAINLVKAVGFFILAEAENLSASDIELKGFNDFVTYIDKEAEQMLIRELKKILPEAGFIAEEDQSQKKTNEFNWIIDPLDGTTNFIHSLPIFSISVALSYKSEIIFGVVYNIKGNECFHAIKEGTAFLNEQNIHVSKKDNLSQSLLATGFPYNDYTHLDQYLSLFKDLMKSARGIRRLGSAAVDLAYVACGRFDVFYEYGLKPWDVAAGSFIVRQAGGMVTDFSGQSDFLFGQQIIASNTILHSQFLEKVQAHFIS
jgi:myo-inositol-1(or 4)-monophosphatase